MQGERVAKKGFSESCTTETECESALCYGGPDAQIGYCTKACEDFSECGAFWSCDLVDGAAFKICAWLLAFVWMVLFLNENVSLKVAKQRP